MMVDWGSLASAILTVLLAAAAAVVVVDVAVRRAYLVVVREYTRALGESIQAAQENEAPPLGSSGPPHVVAFSVDGRIVASIVTSTVALGRTPARQRVGEA